MKKTKLKRSVIKKGKTRQIKGQVRTYLLRGIPDELWREAKAYAGRNGTTVREVILTALREVTK